METLAELQAKSVRLKLELIETEKQIGRHPEHIRRQFCHNPFWKLDRFEALIAKVEFVRKMAPVIEGGEKWHPFVYQMGGELMNVRFCESSLNPSEEMEGRYECDGRIADELWNADDPIEWLEEHGQTWDFKQVGLLLYLTMRDELTADPSV